MEYLAHRGEFQDVPIDQIRETFRKAYTFEGNAEEWDFEADVAREASL